MRIISGTSKGRRLATKKGFSVRPTSDRVKESIFGILGQEVEGKAVLDLYAGTGNLGIEALSRGATKALFIEKGRQASRIIQKNLSRCGVEKKAEVLTRDVIRALGILRSRGETFDIILMDPPYAQGLVQKTLSRLGRERIYHDGSLLVIQHDRREPVPEKGEGWNLIRQRRIGGTLLSFMRPDSPERNEGGRHCEPKAKQSPGK